MRIALGLTVALLLAGGALALAIRMNGAAVLDGIDRLTGGTRGVSLVSETRYGSHASQKLRIYAAAKATQQLPVLLFVHGGSWSWGDPDDYAFIARAFAPEGFIVALAGYRLGEDGRYPAMLEDTAAAFAETARLAPQFGGDPTRIVLAGHSAGAYNVVQIALDRKWLTAAGGAPRGVIGLAGPYDFYPFDKESSRDAFGSVGAGPDSQPVNHARSDAPSMLLIHGERDTLVKPRNSRALAKALEDVGAPVELRIYDEFDHNAPLISLASPWRGSRDIDEVAIDFARRVTEVSVSVQAEIP
ncbi:alpha/beta hydrolase [Qipengyuania qiaonensis]|uniref:Alpha/beta hydrolase n=1 Tax=Qipengyuania qiaonensis TaxID=2867240 RepID=A0ABS7J4A7_9SPHN|nr:alpha/beta hydrolase [Qipengyuania qiaonensis]MBX7482169.1 alpha/beta hydrolase [Qipengyuania qiaonensis]